MSLAKMAAAFLKVGVVGFGGGSALIPVVEKELVRERGLLDAALYEEHTIVANITPGALPVKLGAAAGEVCGGAFGAVLCAMAVALPGTLATVALLATMSALPSGALLYIELAAIGILTFILLVLAGYIRSVYKTAVRGGFGGTAGAAMIAACLLTAGKELRLLAHMLFPALANVLPAQPWLDLSAIDMLLLAFFVIFGTNGKPGKARRAAVWFLAAVFALLKSKFMPIPFPFALPAAGATMLGIAVYSVLRDMHGQESAAPMGATARTALIASAVFLGLPLSLSAAAVLCGFADAGFFVQAALSAATSFGGGEAYVAVADSVFTGGGYITREALYTQILPVANALPGPILVKVQAGVGYMVGLAGGGLFGGLLVSLACFCVGVGATSAVFLAVYLLYRRFSSLTVFSRLKRYILPIVCGLLLTTMLAMAESMLQTCGKIAMPVPMGLAVIAALAAAGHFAEKKLPDAACVALLGTAALSAMLIWQRLA